jgi:DNA (cytosine-5)-methyltransferase 1
MQRVEEHPEIFPGANKPASELSTLVDDGISFIREIARILAVLHGSPDLGNKLDPIDELVYIILARKTRESAYQQTFDLLKRRFPRWDDLTNSPRAVVQKIVFSGGLSEKKTTSLFGALGKLRETFGSCTLEPARSWSNEELERFLRALPEIERKSAYCIMMYSFGRQVFPVDTHVGRVLGRLGLYGKIGLSLDGLDHKARQRLLADLIPPNLRYSLHVNLIQHGRSICRSIKPLCDRCELRNFCAYHRKKELMRIESLEMPTAVDLFSGAGGLSEGFTRAGFKILLAMDRDPAAMKTYALNHPQVPEDRVIIEDIRNIKAGFLRKLVGKKRVDVLIGAPPCQGYSSAGFRSKKTRSGYRPEEDERNFLFEYMLRAATELKPRLFLMENVPGMQSTRKENLSFLESAAKELEKQGHYKTTIWRLSASAFGVPQDRIRYFLVASRSGSLPSRPFEEYQDRSRSDVDHDALPPVTLEEAIFDLPALQAGQGQAIDAREAAGLVSDRRFRRYLSKFGIACESRVIFNHTVRYHNPRDLELYSLLKPGEDSIHILEQHGREDLMRYRKDVFDDKYARLRGDRPCKTIVSHLAKDGNGYIHPDQIRSITLREAARVQSFQDGYIFCGAPTDQWVQLGNAVPPVLAKAIALSFIQTLERS